MSAAAAARAIASGVGVLVGKGVVREGTVLFVLSSAEAAPSWTGVVDPFELLVALVPEVDFEAGVWELSFACCCCCASCRCPIFVCFPTFGKIVGNLTVGLRPSLV